MSDQTFEFAMELSRRAESPMTTMDKISASMSQFCQSFSAFEDKLRMVCPHKIPDLFVLPIGVVTWNGTSLMYTLNGATKKLHESSMAVRFSAAQVMPALADVAVKQVRTTERDAKQAIGELTIALQRLETKP